MNTVVIFSEAAGSRGRENHLCQRLDSSRFAAWRRAGLWLRLGCDGERNGLLVHGRCPRRLLAGRSTAEAASHGPSPQSYPDDELPSSQVAMNDDSPPFDDSGPARGGRLAIQPTCQEEKSRIGGRSGPRVTSLSPLGQIPPLPRHPVAADEGNTVEPGEPFGNSDEGGDENDFGYCGPALRGFLSNRLWFRGEALLWWVRGGQTPPLLTTSPGMHAPGPGGRARADRHDDSLRRRGTEHRPACRRPHVLRPLAGPLRAIGTGILLSHSRCRIRRSYTNCEHR